MLYENFDSVEEAQAAASYSTIIPDDAMATTGLRRASLLRWLDDDTDLLAFMYVGMTPADGNGRQFASDIVFLFEGHGKRCDEPVGGAPVSQTGALTFADGRDAIWALGRDDRGWENKDEAWLSWTAIAGDSTYRIVSMNRDITALTELAGRIAESEHSVVPGARYSVRGTAPGAV